VEGDIVETRPAQENRYVVRLGLVGQASVEDAYQLTGAKILHLMIVAILEQGGPLDLEQMVARLERAGVPSRVGNLAVSVQKAWAGRPPIYRDTHGRFDLDLQYWELPWLLRGLGLLPPPKGPAIVPEPSPPPPSPAPSEPLSQDEVTAAFRDASLYGFAASRQVAAVLDGYGSPLALEAVEEILAGLTRWRFAFDQTRVRYWKTPLVSLGPEGLAHLNRDCPELLEMRAMVRERARPHYERLAAQQRSEDYARAARERERLAREAETAQERNRSHAVLRLVRLPDGRAGCAALLDVERREIRTFLPKEMADLPQALGRHDALAGLDVRDALEVLGLAPYDWKLEELRPSERTVRLNRAGRRLRITFELVSRSTTGIQRPLADPEVLAGYIAKATWGRLRRRLESDVKALYAIRQYAALHGYVRLRWGFIDDVLSLEWTAFSEATLLPALHAAQESGETIALVLGGAPGWAEPWSRVRRCRVLRVERGRAQLAFEGEQFIEAIPLEDIQALYRL
jgi:hypothetical protein